MEEGRRRTAGRGRGERKKRDDGEEELGMGKKCKRNGENKRKKGDERQKRNWEGETRERKGMKERTRGKMKGEEEK